jgi:PAS domain S-box-containing protein
MKKQETSFDLHDVFNSPKIGQFHLIELLPFPALICTKEIKVLAANQLSGSVLEVLGNEEVPSLLRYTLFKFIEELNADNIAYSVKNSIISEVSDKPIKISISKLTTEDELYFLHFKEMSREQLSSLELQSILDSIGDFIFAYTADYRMGHFNKATARLWQMQGVELTMHRRLEETLTAEQWLPIKAMADKAMSGEIVQLEYPFQWPDGTWNFYGLTMSAICDDAGKVTGVSGYAKDITRRHAAELKVAETNQQLLARQQELVDRNHLIEALIDNSMDMIAAVSPDYKLIFCNERINMIGHLLGVSLAPGDDFLEKADGWKNEFKEIFDRVLLGQSIIREFVFTAQDGLPINLLMNFIPMRTNGDGVSGILLFIREVPNTENSKA